jgi:D-beta-D-heptose 7-phosphate kinase/D-beta-D-heptose 1-phosphate adenosyltransferase
MSRHPRQLSKRRSHAELVALREEAWRRGKIVVFSNGCFDVLHDGHVRLLRFAKKQGDLLIVAVNSDSSVRKNKGLGRPVFPLRRRLEALAAISDVDYLTSFSAVTPIKLITRLRPDVLVKGADWRPEEVVGREAVEAAGGRVLRFPFIKGLSSTRLIKTLRRHRIR